MKKFMTLAALAAFAVASQAATVTWGLGGDVYLVKADSTDYSGDAVLANASGAPSVTDGSYLALVYVGQNATSFDIGDITNGSVVDSLAYDTAPYDGGVDYEPFSTDKVISAGDYSNGASFGIVWFDAGRNVFDYVYSGDDGSALNQTVTLDDTGAQGQGMFMPAGDYTQSFAGVLAVGTPVPEPGVALMGLLGLGMMLKRRRA